ncbi:hypothetical protein DACRYDRAFT_110552 [Dacryopinax primogenitus]|uniref:Methyltransferase domain-containing protein n=1 Tax=Dacryopinax primogenitus (strain DJM 731) TaxID=1858805 RepID=M5G4I0_DACPD|nr:uncharacterized protein DACRYDRAFT_110552 [Dacryopinax primogenitus]EJT98647.1 hypothetical protein DACRYDRAFT_110552 [Dacryopinax primogenitus]
MAANTAGHPVAPTKFNPSPDDLLFLHKTTGIPTVPELKAHVLGIQHQALQVHPYPCIARFSFTSPTVARFVGYKKALLLERERKGALLLDIGCCFGADVRKAVQDGFPPAQIVASDLHPEFLELGHRLFRDDERTLPIKFLAGDVLDPSFLSLPPPTPPPPPPVPVGVQALTSLTQLHKRVSAIHASLFFHLFSHFQQAHLAHLLGSLLLPKPGSVIFGHQIASAIEGTGKERGRWAHSPKSWRRLWEETFLELGWEGDVSVSATMLPMKGERALLAQGLGIGEGIMFWCVELTEKA